MNAHIIRFLFGTTIGLMIALLLLFLPMPTPARAFGFYSEITVNTTADEYSSPDDGRCSLREAITTANDNANFGGCHRFQVFGNGVDTILLPSSTNTYFLEQPGANEDFNATGDLDIRESVIISATGGSPPLVLGLTDAMTIWDDRIFHILTGTVTIKGIVISGGQVQSSDPNPAGGAVYISFGTSLTLSDSEVTNNSLFNGVGGGGIYNNQGAMTLTNVTLSGNRANNSSGGGIYNYLGTTTLTNVTLSNNDSSNGFGGGIRNAFGTMTLTNVTLNGNSSNSGGGIYNDFGTTTLTNVTLSGNSASSSGGGIYINGGTTTLTNTIVANNSGGNCSGAITDGGFNLRWPSTDASCVGAFGDPKLAPLGNYGGPTLTHMLKPGSPAIDSGTNTGCPSTNQRGKPRPVNVTCDVGAVERQLVDFSYFLNLPLILR